MAKCVKIDCSVVQENKISIIKCFREMFIMGLKEAKDAVEAIIEKRRCCATVKQLTVMLQHPKLGQYLSIDGFETMNLDAKEESPYSQPPCPASGFDVVPHTCQFVFPNGWMVKLERYGTGLMIASTWNNMGLMQPSPTLHTYEIGVYLTKICEKTRVLDYENISWAVVSESTPKSGPNVVYLNLTADERLLFRNVMRRDFTVPDVLRRYDANEYPTFPTTCLMQKIATQLDAQQ